MEKLSSDLKKMQSSRNNWITIASATIVLSLILTSTIISIYLLKDRGNDKGDNPADNISEAFNQNQPMPSYQQTPITTNPEPKNDPPEYNDNQETEETPLADPENIAIPANEENINEAYPIPPGADGPPTDGSSPLQP